jgi:hypothetical protein
MQVRDGAMLKNAIGAAVAIRQLASRQRRACQSADNPSRYQPIRSGDYLLSRFRDVQKYRGAAAS